MVAHEIHEFAESTAEGAHINLQSALDGIHDMVSKAKGGLLPPEPAKSWVEAIGTKLKTLKTEEIANVGMWLAGGALSAFGLCSAASHSVTRDEDNKAHIQWSNVGVAVLQAALTIGCGFMALKPLGAARA